MNEERHAERRHPDHAKAGEERTTAASPGVLHTFKVVSERTGGAYSMFELSVGPGGGEWPHIQHLEDECLYVLSGGFECVIEDGALPIGEGDTVYIPKGTLHGFKNTGRKPGKLLIVYTPGGSHERFIEEAAKLSLKAESGLSTLAPGSETDFGRLRNLGASYGIELVAPLAR